MILGRVKVRIQLCSIYRARREKFYTQGTGSKFGRQIAISPQGALLRSSWRQSRARQTLDRYDDAMKTGEVPRLDAKRHLQGSSLSENKEKGEKGANQRPRRDQKCCAILEAYNEHQRSPTEQR